ncbi:MAG TPA: flagellar biosynthesis regulator FlaF [Magnetospirillum sp.]|nr:flagellar biosynthesis regulator FlaF [Magnetospirillum sp.]
MSQQELTFAEEQAYQLSQAAIRLDQARQDRSDLAALAAALENNLETWVALKTVLTSDACQLAAAVKENITRLAAFVADRTFQGVEAIEDATIDALINVNLQISEGLLEGSAKK